MRQDRFRHMSPGATRTHVPSSIQRQNRRLVDDLGTFGSYPVMTLPSGKMTTVQGSVVPHFKWTWSENLQRSIYIGDYNEVKVNGVIRLVRREMVVRATTAPRNTWVLTKNLLTVGPEEWSLFFPNHIYPGKIHQEEVTGGGRVLAFSNPTFDLTMELIKEIRKEREEALSLEEMEARAAENLKRKKREELDAAMGVLDPFRPIRPGMPGKRNHPTWQGIGIDLS